MRAPRKWRAAVAAAIALVAGFAVEDRETAIDHRETLRFGRTLDRDIVAQAEAVRVKELLVTDVRAGRLTLAAAADLYLRMISDCDRLLASLRFQFPDAGCDRERAELRLAKYEADTADRDRTSPPPVRAD